MAINISIQSSVFRPLTLCSMGLLALLPRPATAGVEARRIRDGAKHCAFTDMVWWENACRITLRESDKLWITHYSGHEEATAIYLARIPLLEPE